MKKQTKKSFVEGAYILAFGLAMFLIIPPLGLSLAWLVLKYIEFLLRFVT